MSIHHLDAFKDVVQPLNGLRNREDVDFFVRRLAALYPLQPHELSAVSGLVESTFTVRAHQIIIDDQHAPSDALVLLQGLACHYRPVESSRRQLTGFILPGDFCDYGFLSSSATGQNVMSLTNGLVGRIKLSRLSATAERFPNVLVAAMRAAALDAASARELVVSLGARDAVQRLAHLLCEMHYRLQTVGLVRADATFEFAVTQSEIGEALGLSTVHVNRTIQQLRRGKLITMGQGTAKILDAPGLAALALFNPSYLKP